MPPVVGDDVVVADEAGDEGGRGALNTSRGAPACSIRPSFITTTRSASAIASSWLWVTWMKVMPRPRLKPLQLGAHADPQERIERRQRLVEEEDRADR